MEYTGNIVAGDWDKSGFHVTRNGKTVQLIADTVESIVDFVGVGNTFVIEKTTWSYPRDRREQMAINLEEAGIDVRGIDPRMTDKERRKAGITKSNDNDTRVIWHYAQKQPAKKFEATPIGKTSLMNALQACRVDLQKGQYVKSAEWKKFRRTIPKQFKGYTLHGQKVKGISNALLIGLTLLACNTRSRDEFESYLGSYGEGMRSIFRAQYERFGIKNGADYKTKGGKIVKGTTPEERSAYRKLTRQYRSWVLQPGLLVPATLRTLAFPA